MTRDPKQSSSALRVPVEHKRDAHEVAAGDLVPSLGAGLFELMHHVEGMELRQVEPLTTLLVRTRNTVYRLTVQDGSDVLVEGGFFLEPTPARVAGASHRGRGPLKLGWIGMGLVMELHVSGRRIVTSPVVAIAAEARSREE